VVLEPLIHSIPDQAGPDHGSAGFRIVRHLGELSGVDVNPLRRRGSGIRIVTTTLHLKHQEVAPDI